MESSDPKLCRFCFSKPKISIEIFVESNAHIAKVLDEHFGEVKYQFLIISYVNINHKKFPFSWID